MKKVYLAFGFAVLAIVAIVALTFFNSAPAPATTTNIIAPDTNLTSADTPVSEAVLTDADLPDGATVAFTSKHTTCERRWEWYEAHSSY